MKPISDLTVQLTNELSHWVETSNSHLMALADMADSLGEEERIPFQVACVYMAGAQADAMLQLARCLKAREDTDET